MKQLDLIDRLPRILAAQTESANPLYRSFLTGFEALEPQQAAPTLASAIRIGNPVSYERAVKVLKDQNGVVGQANERELVDASKQADLHGLYTCPQTGVALACLQKATQDGTIRPTDRVVVIATAHGLKFTEFKTLDDRVMAGDQKTGTPRLISVEADGQAIRERLNQELDRRA